MMEKEMSSCTLMIIDQLVKLYMDNKIDKFMLQDNLNTKLQFLEYVLETGKVEGIRNEITSVVNKCNDIVKK